MPRFSFCKYWPTKTVLSLDNNSLKFNVNLSPFPRGKLAGWIFAFLTSPVMNIWRCLFSCNFEISSFCAVLFLILTKLEIFSESWNLKLQSATEVVWSVYLSKSSSFEGIGMYVYLSCRFWILNLPIIAPFLMSKWPCVILCKIIWWNIYVGGFWTTVSPQSPSKLLAISKYMTCSKINLNSNSSLIDENESILKASLFIKSKHCSCES